MWVSLPGAQLTQRHKHPSEGINEDLGSVWAGSYCCSYSLMGSQHLSMTLVHLRQTGKWEVLHL